MNLRKEAWETIVRILKDAEYSDVLLQQKARKLKSGGANPAFFYNLVKGTVKYQLKYDYITKQFTDKAKYEKTDIRLKALLYMGLHQLIQMDGVPEHASVFETVELAKELFGNPSADFVNAILRNYQRSPRIVYPSDQVERIAYEHSYPVHLIKEWLHLFGVEKTELLAIHFNEIPRLHIRVNQLATTAVKLTGYFEKRDIASKLSPYSEHILLTERGSEALMDVAFSEGYYTVQDTSAALVVELLDPKPDESVLDFFAAPGGKCTYIAERMHNTGEVIAIDKAPAKMKLLKQTAQRLQIDNIRMINQDVFAFGPVAPAYDKVLVDAPCSGWGVLGRKADLRWQKHQNISELIKLQEKALIYAASFVKPGGSLVYSTCTMNPAENEEQVKSFLRKNPHFTLGKADKWLKAAVCAEGFMKTIPYLHEMDGAFAARLMRKK